MLIKVQNKHNVQFYIEVMDIPPSMKKYSPLGWGYREYPVLNRPDQVEWFEKNVVLPGGMRRVEEFSGEKSFEDVKENPLAIFLKKLVNLFF